MTNKAVAVDVNHSLCFVSPHFSLLESPALLLRELSIKGRWITTPKPTPNLKLNHHHTNITLLAISTTTNRISHWKVRQGGLRLVGSSTTNR